MNVEENGDDEADMNMKSESTQQFPVCDITSVHDAYLAGLPRGVRIFAQNLEVLWDNVPDRASRFPLFRDSAGQHVALPFPGPERGAWPVQIVLNGGGAAQREYRVDGDPSVEVRWFRVRAYRLKREGGADWVVEETEELNPAESLSAYLEDLEARQTALLKDLCHILSDSGDPSSVDAIVLPNARLRPCYEIKQCARRECPAYGRTDNLRCWEINYTFCPQGANPQDPIGKLRQCDECQVYMRARSTLTERIDENINRLLHLIKVKYQETQDMYKVLQQTEKVTAVSELSLGILHEIKNPLSIILGRLDCLELEFPSLSQAEINEDLNVIHSHALRMRRLLEKPLDLARPSVGEFEPILINDIILEVLATSRKTLDRAGVEAKMVLDPQTPRIVGSRVQMQLVLLNLILNARDAMAAGGALTVTSRRQEASPGGVVVEIKDTGPGIPLEDLERIFSPFYSTKAENKGTGLGLAVTRRIVQQHGGQITAQSEPDDGATFRIWFPPESLSQ